MSIAKKLDALPSARTVKKGPPPVCEIYGPGDDELHTVIERRKAEYQESWADIQRLVDHLLGIKTPIKIDRFRYHFTRKCDHW
jgi:hypothetical protein